MFYGFLFYLSIDVCAGNESYPLIFPYDYGELNSPNYPSNYGNSLSCYWVISVSADLIKITFTAFDTADSTDVLNVSERNHLSLIDLLNVI